MLRRYANCGLRRRRFRRRRPPSKAERLRRIADKLVKLALRPRFENRAMATLVAFSQHRGLRRLAQVADPSDVVAILFDRDAGDIARILLYTRALRDERFTARSPELRGAGTGFVRGCLAFLAQEFLLALGEFEAHARAVPTSRSAAASAELARFINQSRLHDPRISASLRVAVQPARERGKSVLVVVAGPARYSVPFALTRGDIVVSDSKAAEIGLDGEAKRIVVDRAYSLAGEGAAWRATFDAMAFVVADCLIERLPVLEGMRCVLADVARARALPAWLIGVRVRALAREHGIADVKVVTSWPSFFAAVHRLAARRFRVDVSALWKARPRLEADFFSYWPSPSSIEARRRAGAGERVYLRRVAYQLKKHSEAAFLATELHTMADVEATAGQALRQSLEGPVSIVVSGSEELLRRLATKTRAGGSNVRLFPDELFEGTRNPPDTGLSDAVRSALLDAAHSKLARTLKASERETLLHDLIGPALATAPEMEQLVAICRWMERPARPVRLVPGVSLATTWALAIAQAPVSALQPRPTRMPMPSLAPAMTATVAGSFKRAAMLEAASETGRVAEGWVALPAASVFDHARLVPICRQFASEEPHAARAEAALMTMWRQGRSIAGEPPENALPSEFERHIRDRGAMEKLASRLSNWRPRSRSARNSEHFALVRGILAFHRGRLDVAHRELTRYALASPDTIAGAYAADIAGFLESVHWPAPSWVERYLQPHPRQADMSSYIRKRVLVLSEASREEIARQLEQVPPSTFVTVVLRYSDHDVPEDTAGHRYVAPHRYEWYGQQGRAVHKRLEAIAEQCVSAVCAELPRFLTIRWALKVRLVDSALYDFRAIEAFVRELKSGTHDEVLIITRRSSLFRTAHAIAHRFVGWRHIRVLWLSRPSVPVAPAFMYWPVGPLLGSRGLNKLLKRRSRAKLRQGNLPMLPPPADRGHVAPAVVAWSIGDLNYERALVKLVETIRAIRPVVVFVIGDDDASMRRLELALGSHKAAQAVQIVRYSSLLATARRQPNVTFRAGRAVARSPIRGGPWKDDPVAAAFVRDDFSRTFVASPHVGALAATVEWLDRLRAHAEPAYVITAPGRSAFQAAIAECLGGADIPTLDVHLYFLADQARQLQPPHRYIATVDSQIAKFIEKYWNHPAEQIIKVGYLWSDQHVQGGKIVVRAPSEKRRCILYASQPSPPEIAQPFFELLLKALSKFDDTWLLVKAHPRESAGAVAHYRDRAAQAGLADRIVVVDPKLPFASLLDEVDLVVTRTSNAALEAASRLKPVVRGVFYDDFLPEPYLEVAYAMNARSASSMVEAIYGLLSDQEVRNALAERQRKYFAENPSLVDNLGHIRLVEFMEARAEQRLRERANTQ